MRMKISRMIVVGLVLALTASTGVTAHHDFGTKSTQPSPAEGIPFEPGAWTIVVMPDTQKESQLFPQVLADSVQWIVDEKGNRNIQLMLHEGDIVEKNNPADWQNAENAISLLDGVVPYVLAAGNHDYGIIGSSNTRTTLMNDFFSAADNPLNDPAQGGIIQGFFEPGKLENTYNTLTAPDGRKLLIFSLEFGPRQRVVDWANGIAGLPQYQDHTAILLTHAYMEEGAPGSDGDPVGIRSNWRLFGSTRGYNPHSYGLAAVSDPLDRVNDGEELWNKLVSQHDNFKLTLNGHYLDEGDSNTPEGGFATTALQTDSGKNGRPVHQIVANYQQQANGGNGYMRLLEFLPDGVTVRVKTYSPTLDLWLNDPRNLFEITIDPGITLHWAGGADDSWDTAANWGRGSVPAAVDLAAITMPGETVLIGAGTAAVVKQLRIAEEDGPSQIDITTGGTLSVGADTLYLGFGSGSAEAAKAGTMNIHGGAVTAGHHMYVGSHGSGILNLTAGSLKVGGFLVINNANPTKSTGHIQLDGGTIDAAALSIKTASGSMDITGGTFVFTSLAEGLVSTVEELISGGHITAYGGAGTVLVDKDAFPGRTILTAVNP